MTITSVISAIGNTNSVYPLIVRDCGIEVPSKIILTYNQNKKESKEIAQLAARERFLDEYAVSAVWLGMIPLVEAVVNKFIKKKGFNPFINLKLFKETDYQGINYNIKKFEGKVSNTIIDELKKVKNNKNIFEKLLAGRFVLSTAIPMLFMGVILPKLIFASTSKKIEQLRQQKQLKSSFTNPMEYIKDGKISFKGRIISELADFSTVNKMAVTDGGYALGRIGTARNKNEAIDVGFKMAGMMFLNFVAPKYIQKCLDSITYRASGLDVSLDPLMFEDKNFINAVKTGTLKLPTGNSGKEIIEFLDKNPQSIFARNAQKFCGVKYLENNIRDPRAYVDISKIVKFKTDIEQFAKAAAKSSNLERFVRKAKYAKCFNIFTNIALSSTLLAYVLPKLQFAFRKVVTGSELEPGIANNKNNI